MIGISGCLAGLSCRYDGKSQTINKLVKLVNEKKAISICPEVLGGLSIPRVPCEIVGGNGQDVWQGKARVMNKDGEDKTHEFKLGAIKAYETLKTLEISMVIIKENSPSCGKNYIYDGSFSGKKTDGMGVATALFINKGIKVYTENELLKERRGFSLKSID